jgi:hypothetical protein
MPSETIVPQNERDISARVPAEAMDTIHQLLIVQRKKKKDVAQTFLRQQEYTSPTSQIMSSF